MTAEEARLELAARLAADIYPELSDAELDAILLTVRIVDSSGYWIADEAYTGAYDLDRAELTGWRRKAAKAVADSDFTNPAGGVSQSQVIQNCLRMAKECQRRIGGVVVTGGRGTVIDGVTI